jgi:uncharacterized protein (DUF433 family)
MAKDEVFLVVRFELGGNFVIMSATDLILSDPEILGGKPVFKGTRVPVKTLFDYLERCYTLDEFLECFPSVSKDLAVKVLERSEAALLAA